MEEAMVVEVMGVGAWRSSAPPRLHGGRGDSRRVHRAAWVKKKNKMKMMMGEGTRLW